LNRKLGGQQNQFGRFGGQTNLLALPAEISDKESALKIKAEEN